LFVSPRISHGAGFAADGWYAQPPRAKSVDVEGACSGDWTGGQIVDRVKIPADLEPGDYVLVRQNEGAN
jgi:hypothetical protein